jgi:hypothetical protein
VSLNELANSLIIRNLKIVKSTLGPEVDSGPQISGFFKLSRRCIEEADRDRAVFTPSKRHQLRTRNRFSPIKNPVDLGIRFGVDRRVETTKEQSAHSQNRAKSPLHALSSTTVFNS